MITEKFDTSWISLTYNCNNRCKWCYTASNSGENQAKSLNPQYEQGIVNLLSDLRVKRVILIGGGPTLYKNLYGFLEKISDSEIRPGLVTNGRRLKEPGFARGLKERGLDYLTVSIEGESPYAHDSATQILGSYEDSIKGIDVARLEEIKVSTNTVINSENIDNLEGLVNSLLSVGIKDIGFNVCGICVSKEENNSYFVNPAKAAEAFTEVYEKFRNEGINFKLVTPLPLCFFEEELRKELREKKIISGGPCQLVHGKNFVVDYNGDIVPCTHLTGFPLLNIFEDKRVISKEKFVELYNDKNGAAYNFREKLKRYPSGKCDDCVESCAGGCPLLWVKFDPQEEIKGAENV